MPDISKIKLPSGNEYNIKDAVAREMISGGVSFIIGWDGTGVPDVTKIPEGVTYNGTTYTGTLDADSQDVQVGAFYLVKSSTTTSGSPNDAYDEYVPVGTAGSRSWEKIGDTQIDLSDVVTGVTLNKSNDNVLGEGTTFTNSTSAVSFNGGSSDVVLGENTTFTNSASAVSFSGGASDNVLGEATTFTTTVTPTTTYIKGSASGTTVGADGTASAITGLGTPTTDTFVKSVSAETNKNLVVTSITPTNGTETVSKVTKTASKLVTTSVPNVTGNTSAAFTLQMGSGDAAETLIIGGNFTNSQGVSTYTATNTTLGTAITAATGAVDANGTGSDVVTGVTISDKTVAKQGSAVTVATGATATDGTGDAVVTGVTIGSSASAITDLGTPTTETVLTGVKVTAQPTVALTTDSSSATGRVQVATGITSASTTAVTSGAGSDVVAAVTNIGTGTAAAQSITVGTNDNVTAVTGVGTATAAAQTITVGTNDIVNALTNGTSLSVTKGNQ